MWYATTHPASGCQALSVAHSDRAAGPFVDDTREPTIFQADLGGSIDPSLFQGEDGSTYLVWKADSNAIGHPSSIWGQRLTDDGAGVAGEPTWLVGHDRRWEKPLVEAPCVFRGDGAYVLAYSAGRWNSAGYSIGFARAQHPLGPWSKVTTREPWICSDEVAAGPGGQETFRAADGLLMLAYHAWAPGLTSYRAGGSRALRIGQLIVDGTSLSLVPW